MKSILMLFILTVFCTNSFAVDPAEGEGTADKKELTKKEVYLLVAITDYSKRAGYSIKTPEEWKDIEKEIKLEDKLFPKALINADKEWRSDEEYGKKTFPKALIAKKTAKILKQGNDLEQITEKLDDMEQRQLEKDNDKKSDKRKQTGATGYYAYNASYKQQWEIDKEEKQKKRKSPRVTWPGKQGNCSLQRWTRLNQKQAEPP